MDIISPEDFYMTVRKSTRKIHSLSDALVNAKFVFALSDNEVWAHGLFIFYKIFEYLEDLRTNFNIPEVAEVYVSESMYRKRAFEQDLEHYLGAEWRTKIPISKSLQLYLDHLRDLEDRSPKMLAAYVYHLYLGLMSGGQLLARKRAIFNQGNTDAYVDNVTVFQGANVRELKQMIRNALGTLAFAMTPEERQQFIHESETVFVLNNSIVKDIKATDTVIAKKFLRFSIFVLVPLGIGILAFYYKQLSKTIGLPIF